MLLKYPDEVDLSYELSKGFAARFIGYKAGRLIGRAGFKPSDREDLEQDLKLHLVRRFDKFDPHVGHWNAFVVTVVSRYVLTLIVQRRRSKRRQDLSLASLDECPCDGTDDEGDFEPVVSGAAAVSALDVTAQHDLALDVQ